MNKHWLIIILFFAIICIPYIVLSQDIVKSDVIERIDGKNYYLHTIEQGQTLYSLSKVYDVPVDELIFENPEARSGLAIGQQLKIPVESREKKISNELRSGDFRYIFHIVKKGQTIYGISRIYDISVDDLKAANPEWIEGLEPGQYLKIPMKDPVIAEEDLQTVVYDDDKIVHVETESDV